MNHSEIIDISKLEDPTLVKKMTANGDKFYLLPQRASISLCDTIDKLSKNTSDKSVLTKLRIAYDVEFALPTELLSEDGETKTQNSIRVLSLSDLLDKFEYDENLIIKNSEKYHVVIDDENAEDDSASKAVAALFQQTVFLNLNIDIKMKSEIKKSLIKDKFRENYSKLCEEIDAKKSYLEDALNHADLTESGKNRISNMVQSFDKMIEDLAKAKKRPIRIAAMGTKKAGKSVVINSLLKRDYAPTSSELPTPNVIKYVPADKDADLTLEYKGKTLTFNSAKDISDYIGSEFENAQKHTGEGSGLDDMIIHYPCDDLSGCEVWDTPGPNFAGAGEEHHKIANECIKEADVCIFVMNYSNHLTDDEVKFLQQIHKNFKEENKFYSLFITVNRIDERYSAEVEKTVNRILDYISGRLEELDYKNIVIFGTSALQSFYLDKVLKLLADDGEEIDDDNTLYDAVRKAKKKHRDLMTPLRFVEDSVKNVEDFHDIYDADVNTIENFSGIPQLWHHVRYVGEQKVDTEIVDHVVSACEMEFAKIKNALLVTELQNLSEEDSVRLKDLQDKLAGLKNTVEDAMSAVISHRSQKDSDAFKAAKYDVDQLIKSEKKEADLDSIVHSKELIKRALLTDDDVESMQNGYTTDNVQELLSQIDEILLNENNEAECHFLKFIKMEGEVMSKRVEKTIADAQDKIIKKTEEIKESVESDSIAGNMMRDFAIPQFPVSLNKLSASAKGLNVDITAELSEIAEDSTRVDTETRTRTVTRERKSRGLWEGITSFFGKKYYEDVEENYDVNVVRADAETFKRRIQGILEKYIKESLDNSYEIMGEEVKDKILNIYRELDEQCLEIQNNYKAIFETFEEDIGDALNKTSEHKKAIEHDIVVLEDVKQNIEPFFSLWNDILDKAQTAEG